MDYSSRRAWDNLKLKRLEAKFNEGFTERELTPWPVEYEHEMFIEEDVSDCEFIGESINYSKWIKFRN